ncbi:SMP-30/gluconolactonase/LRE family protein [[Pseudomonas] boreopolis]|uniref:SMP-30/gluconolactonase/LRE family protein n=1 Tax=Xanthomonas boreopolis TaxID=86183 RepID=UPI003D9B9D55
MIRSAPSPLRTALAVVLLAASTVAPAANNRQARLPTVYVASDYVPDGVFGKGVEGPAVGPDGRLYAVAFGGDGTIGRVTARPDGTGQAELFVRLPEGSTGNGLRFGEHGVLYVADYTGHRVLAVDPDTRQVSTFAADARMHQPNDLARAPDGTLYASDPDWSTGTGQIWRIDREGHAELLETGMGTTNGIEVSPRGDRLYVNESVQRKVWVYDLDRGGKPSNKRLLIEFPDAGLDGMRCDRDGNLYIARYDAGAVVVVSPQGKLLRTVKLKGSKPTNLAFGGKDGRQVYVTLQDRGAIETFLSEVPGRETGRKGAF